MGVYSLGYTNAVYLLLKLLQFLASGNSCRLPSVSFDIFFIFYPPFYSLFSHPMILSKCILYFHSPSPGFDQFPKEPWFLLMENSIQKPTLGALCNHCYWGTTPLVPLSGESYEICVRFCLVLVL